MLELDQLQIRQGAFQLTANWRLDRGEKLALIGASGAGKSTLLAALAGFLRPQSGRILWDGADLTQTPPAARPLSILFQDQNLFPHLTVEQNLGLGLRPDLRLTPDERARVARALERVGLSELATRKPSEISGGQASRAGLARALLRQRPLLLLDEPFAALGPALRDEMLHLVTETAAETATTVILVTHDPQDARAFADQISLVHEAQSQPPTPTAATFEHPPPALAAYLGTARRG